MHRTLVKVFPTGEAAALTPWQEWRDDKPGTLDELVSLAANKFMRNRGGFSEDERGLDLTVYTAPADVERFTNGEPFVCVMHTLRVTRGGRS